MMEWDNGKVHELGDEETLDDSILRRWFLCPQERHKWVVGIYLKMEEKEFIIINLKIEISLIEGKSNIP